MRTLCQLDLQLQKQWSPCSFLLLLCLEFYSAMLKEIQLRRKWVACIQINMIGVSIKLRVCVSQVRRHSSHFETLFLIDCSRCDYQHILENQIFIKYIQQSQLSLPLFYRLSLTKNIAWREASINNLSLYKFSRIFTNSSIHDMDISMNYLQSTKNQ